MRWPSWWGLASALLFGIGAGVRGQAPLRAEVEAAQQSRPSVSAVVVDGAALLRQAGVAGSLEPESACVWHLGDGDPVAVPSRLDLVDGVGRLLWQVPPAPTAAAAGAVARFRLEFGVTAAPAGTPRLPAGSLDNLIDNGGFERATADGGLEGIAPAVFQRDFRRVDDGSGGQALAFNADPEGRGPAFTTPWLAIGGSQAYALSFRHRAEQAEAHPRYKLIAFGYVNYRDAEGKALPRVSIFNSRLGHTDGWQAFSSTVVAPPEARWASLELRNGSQVPYAVSIDDLRFTPASQAEVEVATTAAGRTVRLRLDDPGVRRFDLGPATSPVWDGFQALTPASTYSPEAGFGFTALQRPDASDRVLPEALSRDFITAQRADLRVDLPDGEVDLWLLAGDSQAGGVVVWIYRDQRLSINGTEVLNRAPAPTEFFRTSYLAHYHDFWLPGQDYYDTFVTPRFESLRFPAVVTGGRLLVSWSNLPVAALVVAPRALRDGLDVELERLAASRRRATPVEAVPGPAEEAGLEPSAAESTQGFVAFRRSPNESIYPSSRPQAGERLEALRCFATPGEREPVHLSLWPLRDLGDVRVGAADFVSAAGRIPAAAVDVRVVRQVFKREGRGTGSYRYRVSPYFLDRREAVPVTAGTTWSWWATVEVPEATPAGTYEGALEITTAAGAAVRVPWSLRVLPFRLAPLPIVQGYYYFPGEPWYSTFWGANVRGSRYRDDPEIRAMIDQNERRALRFMASLGLNSVAFGDDLRGDLELRDGEVSLKPDNRLALWMDLYRDAGMGPMPFYGFQPIGAGNNLSWLDRDGLAEPFTPAWTRAYRSLVESCQRLGRERGWPEILWYISDELSNHGEPGAQKGVALAKALAGLPGARVIASMNGPWEHIMVPHLTLSMPNIAFPITDETVAMIRDAGSELWLYNCGDERLNLGLYPWRLKAGGRFQWHFHGQASDPWDDLDGRGGDTSYCLGLPGPDEVVPAIQAQTVREAIDDHRYLATLEKALAAARGDAGKAAVVARAEAFLADLRERIPVDIRTLVGFQVDPRAAGAALGGEFKNTDALDRVRWAAAQLIMDLEGAR